MLNLRKFIKEQQDKPPVIEIPPLWKHQQDALDKCRDLEYFGFFFEVGCLAAHTKVRTNRNGVGREYSIEDLYRKFNNVELAPNSNPWKRKSITYVRSWNGSLIRLNKIKSVVRSGEKQVFDLVLHAQHKSIRATADHEILTRRGFVRLCELVPNVDFVAVDLTTKHTKKKRVGVSNKSKYIVNQIGKFHKYARKAKDPRGKRIYVMEKHRIIYEAHLNRTDFQSFRDATETKNNLLFVDPKKFHIHHKNGKSKDNRIENLELLSVTEHRKMHGAESVVNFGHGLLSYRKVKEIVPRGIEMTYDISCEAPHHNFVANGIVVHNCGKSRALVEHLEYLFSRYGRTLKTIILAPLIVVENLKREFMAYGRLSKQKVITLSGSMESRLKKFDQIQNGNFIVITNYEMLYNKKLLGAIRLWKPEVFVADELHKLKSIDSKRTKAAIQLADLAKYKFGLSGTPILNSQLDLFSQIRVLDGGATFGSNFYIFRGRYFYDANAGRKGTMNYFPNWLPRPGINKALQDLIAPFTMRVRKEDALDLPPLLKKEQLIEMGKNQTIAYNQMKKDLIAFLNDKACVAEMALTKALRLQQIVSGFIKLEDGKEEVFDDVPRLSTLRKILEEVTISHKIIVWCVFKKNYEMVEGLCRTLDIGYTTLHGETKDKQAQIDSFQKEESVKVMIANPGAGGIGINLTAASYMVYYSKGFSLEQEIQSEARNYRGGSEVHEKITRIDLISPGTIDEIISKTLEQKRQIGEAVLDNSEILRRLRNEL